MTPRRLVARPTLAPIETRCPFDVEWAGEGIDDPVGDVTGHRHGYVGAEQDDEFVAAESDCEIGGAEVGDRAFGNADEHHVTGGVSQGVVDGFESVEVDEEQDAWLCCVVASAPVGRETDANTLGAAIDDLESKLQLVIDSSITPTKDPTSVVSSVQLAITTMITQLDNLGTKC